MSADGTPLLDNLSVATVPWALAEQHGLCLSLLGLAHPLANRPCFRAQLRRCRGACCGHEPRTEHDARMYQAMQAQSPTRVAAAFDADAYKILVRSVLAGLWQGEGAWLEGD